MENLNKAIRDGLKAGEEISAMITPEVWEELKKETEKPRIPTLEEQIKMIDKKLEPDCIVIDIETCYIPSKPNNKSKKQIKINNIK